MRKPPLGEYNFGALAGAIVGATGGLFAIGLARAILGRNAALLFGTPLLALLSWVFCGLVGWMLGGQIGPRVGESYGSPRAEFLAGGLAGLLPVVAIALWGWYMVAR